MRRRLGRRREGRARGHARPVRHRACCWCSSGAGHARAALPDGAAQALRDRRAARLHLDDRRPRGRDRAGPMPPSAGRAADRRAPPAPAGLLGGQGRRAARLRARTRAARASSSPSARCACRGSSSSGARTDRAAFAIECSSGTYVRSLIADLGDAYCLELRRTGIGAVRRRRRRRGAAPPARRRARVPARRSISARDEARRGRSRRGGARATRRAPCGCATTTV